MGCGSNCLRSLVRARRQRTMLPCHRAGTSCLANAMIGLEKAGGLPAS